ncbi:hypothetical protein EDD90_4579 [Streptomyces sp. Ag109_O5-1]|nr:hypothetical protein EDD90_4579 [Streptomyces sp. Ag109_O5-1]
MGAVNATGTWVPADASVGAFLESRRQEWDRLFAAVCALCAFDGDEARAEADKLGYFRDYELSPPILVLWSAGVTGVESLRDPSPSTVRRMCRMVADLQLSEFLDMLVAVALDAGTDAARGAPQVTEILTIACALADPTGDIAPSHVHRMWRVAHLPSMLRPDSPTPDRIRAGFRSYDEALEDLLTRPPERGYRYVGPAELAVMSPQSTGAGALITSASDFSTWVGRQSPAELAEPFTYVVDLDGRLRLAPRRSEHVACAGGAAVLGAGEITFVREADRWTVSEVSNQSTGYCPDLTSWPAVARALDRIPLGHPSGFTYEVVFRRCPRCAEHNIVREADFVCVFCGSELPTTWNVDASRIEADLRSRSHGD